MAREILFRGFNAESKQWIHGSLISGDYFFILSDIKESEEKVRFTYFKVIPDSIGQFTGLTDKNGVKIFEGDIIRVCKNKNGAFVVTFKNQYVGGWVLEHSKGELSLGARKQDEIEVIGNVFEHPELIEV